MSTDAIFVISEPGEKKYFAMESTHKQAQAPRRFSSSSTMEESIDATETSIQQPQHASIMIEGLGASGVLHHPPSPILSVDNESSSASPASSVSPSCECQADSSLAYFFDEISMDDDSPPAAETSDVTSTPQPPPHHEISDASFMTLRFTYLLVTLVIMLADGLQGTIHSFAFFLVP